MTTEEMRALARSYAPMLIETLKQIAREASSKGVRESARKALESRGIKLD